MTEKTSRRRLLSLTAGLGAATAVGPALAAEAPAAARYTVTLLSRSPLRFSVEAVLPAVGDRLTMGGSWPSELPEMARQGWPAVVSGLTVADASGPLPVSGKRNHWTLDRPAVGRVRLAYTIDFSLFELAGWSSPLESAIADEQVISVSGRGLFIAGGEAPSEVRFVAPRPWRAMTPWARATFSDTFRAADLAQLHDNMLAFTAGPPMSVSSGGFTLQVAAMGHWRALAGPVRDALQKIVRREVELMTWRGRDRFNVVLVPIADTGGEAYRQSLVVAFEAPSVENRPQWANFLAHEIFHYWNASRMRGADYRSSQWFQEGFTEYAANLTLLSTGTASPQWFLDKLAGHIANAAKLETSLEAIGDRKGPPLYSAGALVAFCWDVAIRAGSPRPSDRRADIGRFFHNLWVVTQGGERPYGWPELHLAIASTTRGDWDAFHARHIAGREPLPLDEAFARAGLRRDGAAVRVDPAASADARAVWASFRD